MLFSKSKRLHDLGKTNNYFISSSKIKIKLQKNSRTLVITIAEDFKFSNIEDFHFQLNSTDWFLRVTGLC